MAFATSESTIDALDLVNFGAAMLANQTVGDGAPPIITGVTWSTPVAQAAGNFETLAAMTAGNGLTQIAEFTDQTPNGTYLVVSTTYDSPDSGVFLLGFQLDTASSPSYNGAAIWGYSVSTEIIKSTFNVALLVANGTLHIRHWQEGFSISADHTVSGTSVPLGAIPQIFNMYVCDTAAGGGNYTNTAFSVVNLT